MKKAERIIKFRDAKGEFLETIRKEDNFALDEKPFVVEEKLLDEEEHKHEDHYHGIHHFDKYGNHDDISEVEFSIRSQFPHSKKALTFKIAMAGLILGLAIVFSLIDSLLEKVFTFYNVPLDTRIFDLLIIIIGLPLVGLLGTLGIAIVEPWFHWLCDGDHYVNQIGLDSLTYAITVCVFFFAFYILFKNSPIHKEPNKKKAIFKEVTPAFIIVPVEVILFLAEFVLSTYTVPGDHNVWPAFKESWRVVMAINLGIQIGRFIIIYVFFAIIENAMRPVNHRYR